MTKPNIGPESGCSVISGGSCEWNPRPIEEFAFACGWAPDDQLLMLWLYLDDSGKWAWNPTSTPMLGFGGAYASLSKWCGFLDEWQSILEELGITEFHATHWRNKTHPALSKLAICVCKWTSPLGAAMPQISLSLAQGMPYGDKSQQKRAYDFAFEDCLEIAAERAHKVGDTVHVVLAQNTEYHQRAFDLFREFKKRKAAGVSLGTFTGDATPKMLVQLQAADLVAWALLRKDDEPDGVHSVPVWPEAARRLFLETGWLRSFAWLHSGNLTGRRSLLD